jgi:hypothetical protein
MKETVGSTPGPNRQTKQTAKQADSQLNEIKQYSQRKKKEVKIKLK